jgi:hypothetical protein
LEFSRSVSLDDIQRVPTTPQHLRTQKSRTSLGKRKQSKSKRTFDEELDRELDEMNTEMGLMSPQARDTQNIFRPADDDYPELSDYSTNTRATKKVNSSRFKEPKLCSIPADVLASIQALRNVQVMTERWVSGLGPVEDWPHIF